MRVIATASAALALAAAYAHTADAAPAQPRRAAAVFAGGCFWCTESDFDKVPGVVSTTSGYIGGKLANPSYEQVSASLTGHAEGVEIVYDPKRVSYEQLIEYFWRTIDPTDPDGQFCDQGATYATAVFATAAQRPVADASRAAAVAVIGERRFVTPVRNTARFWPAESYHQDFARLNPVRYGGYSRFCGREAQLRAVWGR